MLARRSYYGFLRSAQAVHTQKLKIHSGQIQHTYSTPIPEFEGQSALADYQSLHDLSIKNPQVFWGTLARSRLRWMKDFHTTEECDLTNGDFKWFLGGQLNISDNCVDRHAEMDRDRVALIWEKDEPGQQEYVTYGQLRDMVCNISDVLNSHSIGRGDRVAVYMPNSPLAVAVMLACMRVGAIHSTVFAGFSADALATRINDAQCNAVFTSDEGVRGGKIIPLKQTVDLAVQSCPSVQHVFVSKRTGNPDVPSGKLDRPLEKLMEQAKVYIPPAVMESEDPSFMLYTSGSTGKPKGILHSTAGYLLYAGFTHKSVFNYTPGDVYACVADIGWITGHTYVVYGPLANGATTVLFESIPTYPNPGRYWEMVERLKITQFYTAPTALRLLIKSGDEWPLKYDLSSLRTLGCVGEPLNHEAWCWYNDVIGKSRCDVVDTWWQTETGGICISPRPADADSPIKSGMPMRPLPGIQPALVGSDQKELTGNDVSGALCIKSIWPGIARSIYGDHQRFLDTYFKPFPGYYFSGDGAHRHSDGFYQITGRTDDVINISGHRIGTAELEDCMDEHVEVAETAVIGFPHDIKGEGVYAFIVLKDGVKTSSEQICSQLKDLVKSGIAKFAVPDRLLVVPGLPKTRSGKIMRRILRKISTNQMDDLGDVSTLAEPEVVAKIVRLHLQSEGK